jgi:sugar lactone lactonase YvrE
VPRALQGLDEAELVLGVDAREDVVVEQLAGGPLAEHLDRTGTVAETDEGADGTRRPDAVPGDHEHADAELAQPRDDGGGIVSRRIVLLTTDILGPNGLAFSPDEKFFYVDDWDVKKKVVMRYRVEPDGTLSHGEVFFDMTSEPGEQALDGLKVDQKGNLYVSGPGGIWVISAAGKHLGTIKAPEVPANFAWGDEDGRTLYMTARTGLYRVRLKVPGIRP